FQLLCKLAEVEPQKVLYDFMCNAGMESYGLGDTQRNAAMEYFIQCGYGQHYYTLEDMRKMMKELESISGLFPYNCKTKLLDLHSSWRKEYFRFWFRKWFRKYRRK